MYVYISVCIYVSMYICVLYVCVLHICVYVYMPLLTDYPLILHVKQLAYLTLIKEETVRSTFDELKTVGPDVELFIDMINEFILNVSYLITK